MCGIYAVVDPNHPVGPIIFSALKHLEYRGYDSWGIALKTNPIWLHKEVGKLKHATSPHFPTAHIGLGHTRWATHGGVTQANAHPHTDCQKRFVIVHNGIVENFEQLKTPNHHYLSQTDTEVVTHLLEELSQRQPVKSALLTLTHQLSGSNAFVILDTHSHSLYAFKSGSPLILGYQNQTYALSSDLPTLLRTMPTVAPLEDGQLLKIVSNKLTVISGPPLKFITPNWKIPKIQNRYSHHMLSEIHDQPQVWRTIFKSENPVIGDISLFIDSCSLVFIVGCGSAFYAAQLGAQLLSRHLGRLITPIVASELPLISKIYNQKSVVLALSQSGETRDTLDAVTQAKKLGARIVSFTNVPSSSLERLCDLNLPLLAGPEIGVCATKSFTAKLAWFLRLTGHSNQLNRAASAFNSLPFSKIESLKSKIDHPHGFVLGRGLGVPIAQETALKIKEVTYAHFEALSGGELKHGPIALIESGTPVIIHAPNDENLPHNLSSAQEVKARGAFVIGIGPTPHPVFDYHIPVPDLGLASWLLHAVVAQLLAYHLAIHKGLDPDMPRNLAKSVTVG